MVLLKGEFHGKNEFHKNVRVWDGGWCGESLSGQFSFVSEKIELTTQPDDEMGSQIGRVTFRRSQDMKTYTIDHQERSHDQFEIPFFHQVALCVVDFLANEKEVTGKTFATPLTIPNPA